MPKILLPILALALLLLGTGCRSTKGSARIYEGDAPNMKFQESHAGGPLGKY